MAFDKLKKTIVFSSEYNRDFIERYFTDLGKVSAKSFSASLEDTLLEAILPEDENAAFAVRRIYEKNISSALETFYGFVQLRVEEQQNYRNTRPILEYIYSLIISGKTGGPYVLPPHPEYMVGKMESIAEYLETFSSYNSHAKEEKFYEENFRAEHLIGLENYDFQNIDPQVMTKCRRSAEEIRFMCAMIKEGGDFRVEELVSVLIQVWEIIKGWNIPYRLLMEMVRFCQWPGTEEARLKLIELIRKISSEW